MVLHVRRAGVFLCAVGLQATGAFATANQFTTVGPTIYDPDGNIFVAHGINVPGYNNWVGHDPTNDVSLIADAWGFNLVRANCLPLTHEPLAGVGINVDRMIKAFTTDRIAQGKRPVVVMLEAHESTGTYFEGAQLQAVTAWYTDLATRYKDNPYVWFNVGNEPGNMAKPADWPPDQPWDIFLPDKDKWETMHQTVIRAVRDGVGAHNMIVADGTDYGQDGAWDDLGTLNPAHSAILSYGRDLINFDGKTYDNILFDTHVYGMWISKGSTPGRLEQYIQATRAQRLPMIFGEFNTKSADATVKTASELLRLANEYGIGRAAWSWADAGDQADLAMGYDPAAPGTSWATGGGYLINSTTNPTNFSFFGQMIWTDNHPGYTPAEFLGDANGDRRITAEDYTLIDRGYGRHLSGWFNGDFNADGVINSADYLIIDRAYAIQNGALSADLVSARETQFGPAYVAELIASVPEPSAAWVAAGALLARRRRRRRCPGHC